MTPYPSRAAFAAVGLICWAAPFAAAQTAETPPPASEVVHLNAFEVAADNDKSYGAVNSNSITAFNTSLDKLPITADIYDQAFMRDTASTSVEAMIESYSAGAGLANPGGTMQPGDRNSGGAGLTLRGLSTVAFERDGFMQIGSPANPGSTGVGYTSNFDLERAEVINGPQALLYGGGGAGGVVDLVSKQARIGQPTFGSMEFQLDQYGGKLGQLDLGVGNDKLAVRVALMNQTVAYNRIYIGGGLEGYYTQIAYQPVANTTIRVTAEQTTYNRLESVAFTLSANNTANDIRNSNYLTYLLATNQIGAAANGGVSGAGPVAGGNVNWGNVNSFAGWWNSELTVDEFILMNVETKFNSWLSSKLDLGYNDYYDDWPHPVTASLLAPNKSTNPLGVWAVSMTPVDSEEPGRTKAIRYSLLASNDLFHDTAHSQTSVGIDFYRHNDEANKVNYSYYQADANWNILVNPSVSTNDGRTQIGTQYWSVANGPIKYPFFGPRTDRVTLNGINYVRALQNPINPNYVSASNPLGVTQGGGANYSQTLTINKGIYGVNYTNWLEGKLDTIVGFRLGKYDDVVQGIGSFVGVPNAAPMITGATNTITPTVYGFNVGADYAILPWLHPYFSASDSYNPPNYLSTDFYSNPTPISKALGQEVGLKFNNASNTISGSLALYHVKAQNSEFQVSSTFQSDINPSGLNGVAGTPSTYVAVAQESEGAQAIVTASPTNNIRLRLSAAAVKGKIESATSYGQYYNDQFYENSAGQVTYADGTVVYVPATYNSKTLTVTSTTAGAIPLTTALLSSPTSAYSGNVINVNGQISGTSPGGTVLKVVDPVHGAILTGATGLPISKIQIDPVAAGVTIPGTIVTTTPGQPTTGYPVYSFTATGVYTFTSGLIRGLEVGGTESLGWDNRSYMYYPNGFTLGSPQVLYTAPIISRVDGILAYSRKFRRVTWRTQLNVSNLLNHYSVLILPNVLTGYSTNPQAVFSQQPRAYIWTNTISF